MANQMPIPTDWIEEVNGFALGMVCYPNSDMWRRNLKGAIYALTRGRNYDFDTGRFKDIEQLANDLQDSFMSCDLIEITQGIQDIVKTQRMIVLALTGGTLDFEANPEVPIVVSYEGLGPIIKSLGSYQGGTMTIGELITAMEAEDNSLYPFKDYLELLKIVRQITGDGDNISLGLAVNLWQMVNTFRTSHNGLSLMAYLGTGVRGIQSSLVPFAEGSDTPSEQETVEEVYDNIDKANWTLGQVPSMLPTIPTITDFASRISISSASWIGNLQTALSTFWNRLTHEDATPVATITPTGQLAQISKKLLDLDDNTDHTGLTISDRLEAIRAQVEAIGGGTDLEPVLTAIDHILGGDYAP